MDKTLLKGLMVLEAVTDVDNPPRTIDALAARVGLTRSNTHRTLQTLIHAGYVIKDDEGGGYRGAVRLFELAARQLAQLDVRKLAAPYMRTLADQTGETVHLSVLDGFDVVYVDKIDSPQPIRAYSMIGGRAPAMPWPPARRCWPISPTAMSSAMRTSCSGTRRPPSSPCRCSGRAAQGGARRLRHQSRRMARRRGRAGRGAVQQPGPARGGRGHLRRWTASARPG